MSEPAALSMVPLLIADDFLPADVRSALRTVMSANDTTEGELAVCRAAWALLDNYTELSRADVSALLGVSGLESCSC